jgi:hypothetical protein
MAFSEADQHTAHITAKDKASSANKARNISRENPARALLVTVDDNKSSSPQFS